MRWVVLAIVPTALVAGAAVIGNAPQHRSERADMIYDCVNSRTARAAALSQAVSIQAGTLGSALVAQGVAVDQALLAQEAAQVHAEAAELALNQAVAVALDGCVRAAYPPKISN